MIARMCAISIPPSPDEPTALHTLVEKTCYTYILPSALYCDANIHSMYRVGLESLILYLKTGYSTVKTVTYVTNPYKQYFHRKIFIHI